MAKMHEVKSSGKFRSKLEAFCAKHLTDNDIPFEYEKMKVVMVPPFSYAGVSIEKISKKFMQQRQGQAAITYTPDFVGKGWVIECKGHFTPIARLKWKLFKKYLNDNSITVNLYMPTNQKEIREVIEEIKKLNIE